MPPVNPAVFTVCSCHALPQYCCSGLLEKLEIILHIAFLMIEKKQDQHNYTKLCRQERKKVPVKKKSKPDEILDKDKKIHSSDRENCKKCDKILKKEDNARKSICQFCRMMIEYGSQLSIKACPNT